MRTADTCHTEHCELDEIVKVYVCTLHSCLWTNLEQATLYFHPKEVIIVEVLCSYVDCHAVHPQFYQWWPWKVWVCGVQMNQSLHLGKCNVCDISNFWTIIDHPYLEKHQRCLLYDKSSTVHNKHDQDPNLGPVVQLGVLHLHNHLIADDRPGALVGEVFWAVVELGVGKWAGGGQDEGGQACQEHTIAEQDEVVAPFTYNLYLRIIMYPIIHDVFIKSILCIIFSFGTKLSSC